MARAAAIGDSLGRAAEPLGYRLPNRPLAVLHDLDREPARRSEATEAGAAGGIAASFGSLASGATAVVLHALLTTSGRASDDGLPSEAAAAGAIGATLGAALAVAYFAEPFNPYLARIAGDNPSSPSDWKPALSGAALALPVGLAAGFAVDLFVDGSSSLIPYAVAVPLAQGIGAGLSIFESRRAASIPPPAR